MESTTIKVELPYLPEIIKEVDGKSILDVGCGFGFLTSEIKKKLPDSLVRGCDIGLEELSVARQVCDNDKVEVVFDYVDIRGAVPYENKSFDTVVSAAVLMMMPEKDALNAINNIKRIARKKIILAELNLYKAGVKEVSFGGIPCRYARDYGKFFWGYKAESIKIKGWPGEEYELDGSVIIIT